MDAVKTTGVFGGCGCLGGLDDLKSYTESTYSKAKQDVIKKLAAAIGPIIGEKNLETKSIKEIHAVLNKTFPAPEKNRVRPALHKEFCDKIVFAINNIYGRVLVDAKASTEDKCEFIGEFLDSLFVGYQSEFLSVSEDVRTRLEAVETLSRLIEAANKKLVDMINKSETDPSTKVAAEQLSWIMAEVAAENDKQLALLRNMFNIAIKPIENDMIISMQKKKNLQGLMRKLQKVAGTQEFGVKLAYLLEGIEAVSYTTHVLEKALKDVGMSYDEYLKIDGMSKLVESLEAKLRDMKNPSFEELSKFLNSSNVLKQYNYRKSDLAPKTGGGDDDIGTGYVNQYENLTLGQKIKISNKNKNTVRSSFINRLSGAYGQLTSELDKAVKKVGTSATFTDAMDEFAKALDKVDEAHLSNNPSFIRALLGEYEDANARDVKNKFIMQLKNLGKLTKKIKDFEEIDGSISNIVKIIDEYSDVFGKVKTIPIAKKGAGEDDEYEDDVYGAGEDDEYEDDVYGGVDDAREEAENLAIQTLIKAGDYGDAVKLILADNAITFNHETKELIRKSLPQMKNYLATKGDSILNYLGKKTDDAFTAIGSKISSFGAAEKHNGKSKGKGKGKRKYFGGDCELDTESGLSCVAKVTDTSKSLTKSIKMFKYQYTIARIRDNLKRATFDQDLYNTKYEGVLGDAIGYRIEQIKTMYNQGIKNLDEYKDMDGTPFRQEAGDAGIPNIPPPATATDISPEQIKMAKNYLEIVKNTRVKFYKTLEAIDIYLGAFADGISKNPDDVGDLFKILESLQINTKWYTDKVGDEFAFLFDEMPSRRNFSGRLVGVPPSRQYGMPSTVGKSSYSDKNRSINGNYWNTVNRSLSIDLTGTQPGFRDGPGNPFQPLKLDHIDGVLKKAANVVCSVTVLKNIVSTFVTIGKKFGGEDLLNKCPLSPKQIYTNLTEYVYVSAYTNCIYPDYTDRPGRVGQLTNDGGPTNDIEYINVSPGTNFKLNRKFSERYTFVMRSVNNIPMRVYNQELNDYVYTPKHAYLKTYIPRLPLELEEARGAAIDGRNRDIIVDWYRCFRGFYPSTDNYNVADYHTGPHNIPIEDKHFEHDDQFFLMAMQSIVAKVLTSVGVYVMLNKPHNEKDLYAISPYRQILGGADSTPTVDAEIAELYVRLPLLVEYYRDLLDANDASGTIADDKTRFITIVPDFDNVWSTLLQIIYDKTRYVNKSIYSTNQIQEMISAINAIYTKYKALKPENTVREIYLGLVAEMNKRFGFYCKAEVQKWLKNRQVDRYKPESEAEQTNFEILPGESDVDYAKPSPSDKFVGLANRNVSPADDKLADMTLRNMVNKFRSDVTISLTAADDLKNSTDKIIFTFKDFLDNMKTEISTADTADKKFEIVKNAVQESNRTSTISGAMTNIMLSYHELVVAPLYTLVHSVSTIVRTVKVFNKYHYYYSLLYKYIEEIVKPDHGSQTVRGQIFSQIFHDLNPAKLNLLRCGDNILTRPATNAAWNTEQELINNINRHFAPNNVVGAKVNDILPHVLNYDVGVDHLNRTFANGPYRHMLNTLIQLKDNSMVEVNINKGIFIIDFKKYEDSVDRLLVLIKTMLEKFRPLLKSHEILKIEGRNSDDIGTIVHLESLIDDHIKGKNNRGLVPSDDEYKATISTFSESVNLLMQISRDVTHGLDTVGSVSERYAQSFGLMLFQMIQKSPAVVEVRNTFYEPVMDTNLTNFANTTGGIQGNISTTVYFDWTQIEIGIAGGFAPVPTGALFLKSLAAGTVFSKYNSFIVYFNTIVREYLNLFYNPQSDNIYSQLIDSFANSVGNDIYSGKTIYKTYDMSMGVPAMCYNIKDRLPLDASLGYLIKRATTLKNTRTNSLPLLETDVSKLSEFYKESLRGNLPYFKEMFETLSGACLLIVDLLESGLKVKFTQSGPVDFDGLGIEDYSPDTLQFCVPYQTMNNRYNSVEFKEYLTTILNKLNRCSEAFIKCCNITLKDVENAPVWGEIYKGSITDYTASNNVAPLALPSLIVNILVPHAEAYDTYDVNSANNVKEPILPCYSPNDDYFKYNYAVRKVICDKFNVQDLTIVKNFIQQFNSFSNAEKISQEDYFELITEYFRHAIYFGKISKYKSGLVSSAVERGFQTLSASFVLPSNSFVDVPHPVDILYGPIARAAVDDIITGGLPFEKHNAIRAPFFAVGSISSLRDAKAVVPSIDYEMSKYICNAKQILEVLDATNQNLAIEKILAIFERTTKQLDRKNMRLLNLIDLNIVPINFHLLRKEIPLANIFNYAYTFKEIIDNCGRYSEILKFFLTKPYENLPKNINSEYDWWDVSFHNKNFQSLETFMLGATFDKLGRPRFLSDQLWNKALFRNLKNSSYDVSGVGQLDDLNSIYKKIADYITAAGSTGPVINRFKNDWDFASIKNDLRPGQELYDAIQAENVNRARNLVPLFNIPRPNGAGIMDVSDDDLRHIIRRNSEYLSFINEYFPLRKNSSNNGVSEPDLDALVAKVRYILSKIILHPGGGLYPPTYRVFTTKNQFENIVKQLFITEGKVENSAKAAIKFAKTIVSGGPDGNDVSKLMYKFAKAILAYYRITNKNLPPNATILSKDTSHPTIGIDTAFEWASDSDHLHNMEIGRDRFDSRLVRNMTMFVSMHMVMRDTMFRELEKIDGPVVQNIAALNRNVTEFDVNETNAEFAASFDE